MGRGATLLSQQLLLPLPVLLKTLPPSMSKGSQSPAVLAPTPAPRSTSGLLSWLVYSPQALIEGAGSLPKMSAAVAIALVGCSQMLSPLQMCSAKTKGEGRQGLFSGGAGIPAAWFRGPSLLSFLSQQIWEKVGGGKVPHMFSTSTSGSETDS